MPLYDYYCCDCGRTHEEFLHIRSDTVLKCPSCASPEYRRQVSLPHTPQEYHTPIHMQSIGMTTVEDVRDFQRRCPSVPVSDDPSSPDFGVPIAHTRQQKLAALRAAGYCERN